MQYEKKNLKCSCPFTAPFAHDISLIDMFLIPELKIAFKRRIFQTVQDITDVMT
jgi:hypothetical protein